MVDRLPGLPELDRVKLGPIDSKAVRKSIKKSNLSDAKRHFPHRVNLAKMRCTADEAKQWLMSKRYRSWKQHGINGDYYYDTWAVLWFANKSVATEFVLSLS